MTIHEAVKTVFEEENWKYADQDGWLKTAVMLDGPVESMMLQVSTGDTALVTLSAPDFEIPEDAEPAVLLFVNALNTFMPMGCLYLDYEERVVVCKVGHVYVTDEAELRDVEEYMFLSMGMAEYTARILPALSSGELAPMEAAMQVLDMLGEEE